MSKLANNIAANFGCDITFGAFGHTVLTVQDYWKQGCPNDLSRLEVGDIVQLKPELFDGFCPYPPTMRGDLLVTEIRRVRPELIVLCEDGRERCVERVRDLL